MKYDDKIQQFRSHLQNLGYSPSSVKMLPNCITSFLNQHQNITLQKLTSKHIQQFYQWLQIRPNKNKEGALSEAFIYHHIYAIRLFFNWLETNGEIRHNPMSVMKFKRPEPNTRKPLTEDEIQQLFEAAETLKEKALLHIFYSCGLRKSEGEKLNIRDIHFKQNLLYVREGKGKKRRVVPLTKQVSHELEIYYLQERTQLKRCQDTEAFMLNKTGKRMSGCIYNELLKCLLKRACLSKEITLHHLRHSIATHLLENGLGIEQVRDFLGHAYMESTQIYAKVNPEKLKQL
jgi:site-specific recombinase XerD